MMYTYDKGIDAMYIYMRGLKGMVPVWGIVKDMKGNWPLHFDYEMKWPQAQNVLHDNHVISLQPFNYLLSVIPRSCVVSEKDWNQLIETIKEEAALHQPAKARLT